MFSSNLSTDLFQSQLRSFFRPYWGDFGDILEKTWFLGHRVWFECFFFGSSEFVIFPIWAQKKANARPSAPRGFFRNLKNPLTQKEVEKKPDKNATTEGGNGEVLQRNAKQNDGNDGKWWKSVFF